MKQVLLNIALFGLVRYCRDNGIDCSGTDIRKAGRGYRYELIKQTTGKPIASATFHRSNAPLYLRTIT